MKLYKKIALIFICITNFARLFSGLLPDTMVLVGDESYVEAKDLEVGDYLPVYKFPEHRLDSGKIIEINKNKTKELFVIEAEGNKIIVGENQKLYERTTKTCISAKDFKIGDMLFSPEKGNLIVTHVEKKTLDNKVELYDISVEGYLFLILTNKKIHILVHNNPAAVAVPIIDLIIDNAPAALGAAGSVLSVLAGLFFSASHSSNDHHSNHHHKHKERDRDDEGGSDISAPYKDVGDGYITKEDIERNRKWIVYGEVMQYLKEQEQKKNATGSPVPQPPKKDDDDKKKDKKDSKNPGNTQKQETKAEGNKDEQKIEKDFTENSANHAFGDRPGHLSENIQANRQLLKEVANDEKCFLGKDSHGTSWYAKITKDGRQIWTTVRGNRITNGGVNATEQPFDPETGLCRNIKAPKR